MRYITLLFLAFLLYSCEDVVEVDLDDDEPRLIVDALIRIDTSQELTNANIEISLSSSFFGDIESVSTIDNMQMQKADTPDGFVPYEAVPGEPGMYRPFAAFGSPVSNNQILTSWLTDTTQNINLFITFNDKTYLASTSFAPSVPIDELMQGDGQLFDEDTTELEITFTDFPDREDYYIFDFDFDEFIPSEDRFYAGQQFSFSYFYDENLEAGDEVNISILGADESFFDYMNGILEQSEQGQNGPFQTPTATVRGNFLNVTGIDNMDAFDNSERPDDFILGYFALSQEYTGSIIIE